MSECIQLEKRTVQLDFGKIPVVVVRQNKWKIRVKEELGHFLLIDADDCGEMFVLASLFQHALRSRDVIFLQREDASCTNLFVFNGAVHPLTRKDMRNIMRSLRFVKAEPVRVPLLRSHDESVWDTWQHWKYDEQLSIKADRDLAVINASRLGLELLVHVCAFLAVSYAGHSHVNRETTPSSPELIIRNIARN
mgnify:FL=1